MDKYRCGICYSTGTLDTMPTHQIVRLDEYKIDSKDVKITEKGLPKQACASCWKGINDLLEEKTPEDLDEKARSGYILVLSGYQEYRISNDFGEFIYKLILTKKEQKKRKRKKRKN